MCTQLPKTTGQSATTSGCASWTERRGSVLVKCVMLSRLTGLTSHPLTWAVVHRSLGDMGVNNILALVDLIHSLPPTTVLNETSFNQMKLIKTSRRHRMAGPTLNDCMVVRLESASVREFDPSPAVTRWLVSLLNYKISPRPNTVIQNQIHLIHY